MINTAFPTFFVGLEDHINRLERTFGSFNNQPYPPYNLKRIDEDHYTIEVALAGFDKKDLEVTVKDEVLTISGKADEDKDANYIRKGIGKRAFTHSFALAEYIEVKSAEFDNGMLYVDLIRIVPEEAKPKQITIK